MELEPLAIRVRPKTLDEFVGQEHLVGEGAPLFNMYKSGKLSSFIIWGPPGSGKTTIAQILTQGRKTITISATTEHIKDVKKLMQELTKENLFSKETPIVIVDEIQHFNRKEQDAFLTFIEQGKIILIALTTENPSFYVNNALLSRLSVFVFNKLTLEEIKKIILNAIKKDEILKELKFEDGVVDFIAEISDGDARIALNNLENISKNAKDGVVTLDIAKKFSNVTLSYGKEAHYDLISAFIKSMRGSDPDAALYYMYRMIEAGEDPLYIARRMIRFASEDIGLKDPMALVVAVSAFQGFNVVGPPEGYLILAEACVYLSKAPKDNSLYLAEGEVKETIKKTGSLEVPLKLRNPVTKLMENLGYGKDYKYPHDYPGSIVKGENYLPKELKGKKFLKGS
ncbi:replication-associated recombination protein A [Caldisericum exile]|uniref:Replication-associated recombination protein A n=1 Tax=Caldisericum exile (strain DSM 21853 / NBRC 104410 / AZM16c01) TaxID=511051 RepID=A0A7U6GFH7_CALEA|nr:replication-associated recombination protein A [Caldisericum exile]BAL81404.1 putative ATPase [Caldisericum exile AZM16c01]